MEENNAADSAENQQPSKLKHKFKKWLNYPKSVQYDSIRQARKAAKDLIIYLIFLALATVVTQTSASKMYFYAKMLDQQLAASKTVVDSKHIITFKQIHSYQQFWDFIEFTFLPWLKRGDYEPIDLSETYTENILNIENRTIMQGNVLLGPPRLRQIRVLKDQCEYHAVFSKYFPECYTEYSLATEDRSEYNGIQWQSMSQAGTTPLRGELGYYWSAGYLIHFSYNNAENLKLVKRLRAEDWLNQGSRVFLLEFNLYHVDTHLFQLAKFMVEHPPSGACVPTVKLRTLRRESFFSNNSWLMAITTFAFYVFITLNTCREIVLITNMGFFSYISFPINLADFCCCLLSYLLFLLNIAHFIMIESVMSHMAISDQYINLDILWELNIIYHFIAGCIIFIAWIRLLHFMAISRSLVIILHIFKKIKADLTGFLILLFIFLMAYTHSGMILFGGNDPKFRTLLASILTILNWTVRNAQFANMQHLNYVVPWFYYTSFIVIVYMMLLLSFKAIVINTYDEVKQVVLTRPSRLGTAMRLVLRDICDLLHKLFTRKRRKRTQIDLDASGDYETDQRIDPRQAAEMIALRHMEQNAVLTPPEYLPGRFERWVKSVSNAVKNYRLQLKLCCSAVKRVQVLNELTNQSLRRLSAYYRALSRQYNVYEMSVEVNGTVEETVI